jgi:hypothetical protein
MMTLIKELKAKILANSRSCASALIVAKSESYRLAGLEWGCVESSVRIAEEDVGRV